MKKSLITLLALVLSCLMIFTACGDKGEDKEENKEEETTVSTQDTTATPDVDDTTAAPDVDVPSVDTPVATTGEVTYATISEDNQILEGVTFFYDSNNIVTKVSFEMVSNPDEVLSQENLDGFEQAYSGFEQFKGSGYNLTADYGVVDGIHTLEIIITLSGENEIDLFAQLLGFFPTEDYVTLAEAEDAAISAGYALFNPEA